MRGRQSWTVTFHTRGNFGAHVRCTGGPVELDRDLTAHVEPQAGIAGTKPEAR